MPLIVCLPGKMYGEAHEPRWRGAGYIAKHPSAVRPISNATPPLLQVQVPSVAICYNAGVGVSSTLHSAAWPRVARRICV